MDVLGSLFPRVRKTLTRDSMTEAEMVDALNRGDIESLQYNDNNPTLGQLITAGGLDTASGFGRALNAVSPNTQKDIVFEEINGRIVPREKTLIEKFSRTGSEQDAHLGEEILTHPATMVGGMMAKPLQMGVEGMTTSKLGQLGLLALGEGAVESGVNQAENIASGQDISGGQIAGDIAMSMALPIVGASGGKVVSKLDNPAFKKWFGSSKGVSDLDIIDENELINSNFNISKDMYLDANKSGLSDSKLGDYVSYYTPTMQKAYDMGQQGIDLGNAPIIKGFRFGGTPSKYISHNYADNVSESGLSVYGKNSSVRPEFEERGNKKEFTGILVDTGSDGEPVILPFEAENWD